MKKVEDLNRLYAEAEEVDKKVFAEMRSNVLLVSGEHYSNINQRETLSLRRGADSSSAHKTQKLRLTKNHTYRVSKRYQNAILAEAPDVSISPQRESEIQDKKDAELNKAVYEDGKRRYKFKQLYRRFCKDFVDIGEVCYLLRWDTTRGEQIGFEPMVDDETGEMVLDPLTGEPIPDETKPVRSGEMEFRRIYGFNLLRSPTCDDMETNDVWIVRDMVKTRDLNARYSEAKIQDSRDETYVVFDAQKVGYGSTKGMTLLKEFYYKPCMEYPDGWFVFMAGGKILEQGPLPYGIFPLVWASFDENQTSPRGRTVLKQSRPYQAEINRAGSQQAQHQITMGDDKLLYQANSKLAQGTLLPGVRGIAYTGREPLILQGRNGSQFGDYVKDQINELDHVTLLNHLDVLNEKGQLDPYALLYLSASQKRDFAGYTSRFEQFMIDFVMLYLELCKRYLPDEMYIAAVGKNEAINIAEFRKTTALSYQIAVDASTETLETRFGRQLTLQHVLQYVGNRLDPQSIGKIVKNMPFGAVKDSLSELTLDEDIIMNDMLAMERGEAVEPTASVDSTLALKRVDHRIKEPSFKMLPPQVQQLYAVYRQQYLAIQAQQVAAQKAAQSQIIPTDGPMVTVSLMVPDGKGGEKKLRLPVKAIEALVQQLESQGDSIDKMESLNKQTVTDLANMLGMGQGQGQQMMQPGVGNTPMLAS